jgi:hypothetical protein
MEKSDTRSNQARISPPNSSADKIYFAMRLAGIVVTACADSAGAEETDGEAEPQIKTC